MLKGERLDLRLTTDEKAAVERAAVITGSTTAGFAKASMLDAAHRIIAEANTWRLGEADWDAFTAALSGPADPRWEAFLAEPSVWQQ
ncbi:MAG: DUF1778 domain-containing protein [Propionibacteriaceae bacterium]|jgi:uncharacterized protein (DUF1778 family)|nr:DUF1778 domain-containing protein [Propionibacteriaceae bacterium]